MQNLKKKLHYEQACFATLRPLLEEMVGTLKSSYIKSDIGDEKAVLEVGSGDDRVQWVVRPSLEGPAYYVNKNQFFAGERDSDQFIFDSETETIEYVVKEIIEKIVYCQYWKRDVEIVNRSGG